MTKVVDKEVLKEALRELIREEPDLFRTLMKEALAEEFTSEDADFDRLVQQNFQRFEATFRALA